jgi:peptide deformylase
MILPIVAYGMPILREKAQEISADYPNLKQLIADMWETMHYTNGVGLAAPQINKNIRLFVVDSTLIFEGMEKEERIKYTDAPGLKQVFINPIVNSFSGENWVYNEGCLSIPRIREDVNRPQEVTISYLNEDFELVKQKFTGITARVIQHEYDHIDGKLFIDYLKPLKKKLLQSKLSDISKGKIKTDYRMVFAK